MPCVQNGPSLLCPEKAAFRVSLSMPVKRRSFFGHRLTSRTVPCFGTALLYSNAKRHTTSSQVGVTVPTSRTGRLFRSRTDVQNLYSTGTKQSSCSCTLCPRRRRFSNLGASALNPPTCKLRSASESACVCDLWHASVCVEFTRTRTQAVPTSSLEGDMEEQLVDCTMFDISTVSAFTHNKTSA
eukprot:3939463-Rhodomonas_salina.2